MMLKIILALSRSEQDWGRSFRSHGWKAAPTDSNLVGVLEYCNP